VRCGKHRTPLFVKCLERPGSKARARGALGVPAFKRLPLARRVSPDAGEAPSTPVVSVGTHGGVEREMSRAAPYKQPSVLGPNLCNTTQRSIATVASPHQLDTLIH
jgi:hypothetical protein